MKVSELYEEYLNQSSNSHSAARDEVAEVYIMDMDENIEVPDNAKPMVFIHLHTAVSHRRWIRVAYELVKELEPNLSADMAERIRVHDLSKFSSAELIGYGYMFGKEAKLNEEEMAVWQSSLDHHYAVNDHHPENFGQGNDIPCLAAFQESVIDRLGCRLERNLYPVGLKNITVEEIFAIPDMYLEKNYSKNDLKKVKDILQKWCSALKQKGPDFLAQFWLRVFPIICPIS